MANIHLVTRPKSVEEVVEQRVSCNQFHNDQNHYALPGGMTKEDILKITFIHFPVTKPADYRMGFTGRLSWFTYLDILPYHGA